MKIESKNRITEWIKLYLNSKVGASNRFYAEFLLFVNIRRNDTIDTMGVYIEKTKMYLLYNEEFTNNLSNNDLTFILFHEVSHLLSNHVSRIKNRNLKLSNITQDMIINTNISNTENYLTKPKNAYFIPKEYTGDYIFEVLYNWVENEKEEYDNKNGDNDKNNSDEYNDMQKAFKNMDNDKPYTMDEHIESDEGNESMNELNKELIRDIMNNIKQRGLLPGNIESMFVNINKSKKDYLKLLKSQVSNKLFGSKIKRTYKKMNRYGINGIKGNQTINKEINVILDTSYSMVDDFEQVLSYIFRNNYVINLVQIDTKVQSVVQIHNKNELKKLKIKGLGGTILQPAVDYLIEKKLNIFGTLVLTDGYCEKLNFNKFKSVLVLSTGIEIKTDSKVKQIVIK